MKHTDAISWNAMAQAHSEHGQVEEALNVLKEMLTIKMVPSDSTFCIILKMLAKTSNLHEGRIIHNLVNV
jgi:pentatricopeptide repeat protein